MIGYASLYLVDTTEFRKIIKQQVITTVVPDDAHVVCSGTYSFRVKEPDCIEPTEFLKQVEDTLHELRGEPTTTSICVSRFKSFIKSPSDTNKEELKNAYLEIPVHRRKFVLGDMDFEDTPIKSVIYAEQQDPEYLKMLEERYVKGKCWQIIGTKSSKMNGAL